MSMLQTLPDAPLDIVGDVHGELDALQALLHHLGYDPIGRHPAGRRLVFVGDLCDRGPDSPGVIDLVRRMVEAGTAQAIIGNHEINLLRGDRKHGNNWFWDADAPQDNEFEPYRRISHTERQSLLQFLEALPLVLVRDDLRVVHAAWDAGAIQKIEESSGQLASHLFEIWDLSVERGLEDAGFLAEAESEGNRWGHALNNRNSEVPFLEAIGHCDVERQMGNPVRVIVSGTERLARAPFFSSGKWRFSERTRWWDDYQEAIPVVIGHYWRLPYPTASRASGGLFQNVGPTAWHGALRNVFCIDYSAGARFEERLAQRPLGSTTRLTALQWPERTLVTEDGTIIQTTNYGG